MRSIGGIVTAAWLLAGCGELAPGEGSVEQPAVDCPENICGNSPMIEYRVFHELHELGLPNAEGFRIVGFEKNGVPYTPDVARGKLRGSHNGLVIAGAALVGARLRLRDDKNVDYLIRIDEVGEASYWADAGHHPPTLETYLLTWVPVAQEEAGQWQNLCGKPIVNNDDVIGMDPTHVVLHERDRIDRNRRTIQLGDDTWFNIGCAGHAIAKLALTGHTAAARFDGFATTPDERQAMLKMLSADYCGRGTPYTVAGQPLAWRDHRGWMGFDGQLPVEARWTSAGATCLNEPRVDANPSDLTIEVFGADPILDKILAACPLPACTGTADELLGAHLVSVNPP